MSYISSLTSWIQCCLFFCFYPTPCVILDVSHGCVLLLLLDDSVFSEYRAALCSMVFSALSESNASLQITAASVLSSLAQETGEKQRTNASSCLSSRRFKDCPPCCSGLLLDSDIQLAVDHLTRLLLTEEDERVRSASVGHIILSLPAEKCCVHLCLLPNIS